MVGIYCRTSKDTNDGASIEQQRNIGIGFCELNNFEYMVYEDKGKSGFLEDDDDPHKNRPDFKRLLNDIKNGLIKIVWVYEYSRISRNLSNSIKIFSLFDNYNVRVFEKNNEINLKDNTSQFLRNIIGAVDQHERNRIVERTTRGLYDAIDKGNRAHAKFYGYKRIGKNEKGNLIWEPVQSEIEKLKFAYRKFLEGSTLRQITYELNEITTLSKDERRNLTTKWARFLKHFEYTGYSLNMAGLNILHQYNNFEIDNIKILNDVKYYVKSQAYKEQLITIEEWLTVVERLHVNRKALKELKINYKKASRDLGTGIIKCSDCGFRYYAYLTKDTHKGNTKLYNYYKHISAINNKLCGQKPKTVKVDKMDEIFKLFYFFFFVVFDNTKELMKASQKKNKLMQLEIKDKISILDKANAKIERQIAKFNTVLDEADNIDDIKVLAHRITENENILKMNKEELARLKINIEKLNIRIESDELTMTYYDVKERVLNWFNNITLEQQRNELLSIINECLIYNHHIIIEARTIVFLFDLNKNHTFDMKLLDNLNKDEIYKKHFTKMKGKREARKYNDKLIHNVNLERENKMKVRVFEYLLQKYNIAYNFIGKTNLISFVPLTGIMSLDTENAE